MAGQITKTTYWWHYLPVVVISYQGPGTTPTIENLASFLAATGSGPGYCPSNEYGIVLTGHVTAPAAEAGKSTEITTCYDTDSGTGTSGSFAADLAAEAAGNTSIVITSAGADSAASSVVVA